MIKETLKELFRRDLGKLKQEIAAYKDERHLWMVDKEIANSAGNLCLHLAGNLSAFIGAELGDSGYVRARDLEFSLKDVPRTELLGKIDETLRVVERTLDRMTAVQFYNEYPKQVFGEKMTTEFFLVHLTTHLAYHLGQINYHRRLLDI